ncbi:RNA-directed DNA polymerase, eukaryota [Tanacetum coccineum]
MHDHREPHLAALKRILRYVRGTTTYGVQLYASSSLSLLGYTDADWAGCPTTRRSTSCYCVFLGNNLISWSSKRQVTLSHSSAEAEYRGVANVVAETAWIRNLLRELHSPLSTATLVYCDNVSAVYLSSNPVQHQQTKHIEIDIHFVRDQVAVGRVRVLHVSNLELLIENLCMIWIGSFHLHANSVRFQREAKPRFPYSNNDKRSKASTGHTAYDTQQGKNKDSFASILKSGTHINLPPEPSQPAIVLDDSCLKERDFSSSLMGKVKEVSAIPNLRIILSKEGFHLVKLTYLGGLWVLIEFDSSDSIENFCNHKGVRSWFELIKPACNYFVLDERIIWVSIEGLPIISWTTNTFSKVDCKWGDLVVWDESEESTLSCKHLCLKTKTNVIINESFKIIIKRKVHWIRAKELDAWVPKFLSEEDSDSSDSSDEDSNDYDGGGKFGDMEIINSNDESDVEKVSESSYDSDPTHPLGFTPENENHIAKDTISSPKDQVQSNASINLHSCSNVGLKSQRTIISRGSILDVMDDLVKIGHTMGYNMDGCLGHKAKKRWINELCSKHKINFAAIQETKMESIDLFSIKALWGNLNFNHAVSSAVGNSGVMGTWTPTSTKLLVISIYAPQELSEKRDLWDYIYTMIDRWDGETVVLGDFSEVRTDHERFGSIFNHRGANAFNNFISKSDLIYIPMGGYSFTWSHKSAVKMSKLDHFLISKGLMVRFLNLSGLCLERHLSDHRPIIMFESSFDYGPTPFRMFHSWFKLEGFDNLVETLWLSMDFTDSNRLIRLKKKPQLLKSTIKTWVKENKAKIIVTKSLIKVIDQGGGNDEIINITPRVLGSCTTSINLLFNF